MVYVPNMVAWGCSLALLMVAAVVSTIVEAVVRSRRYRYECDGRVLRMTRSERDWRFLGTLFRWWFGTAVVLTLAALAWYTTDPLAASSFANSVLTLVGRGI